MPHVRSSPLVKRSAHAHASLGAPTGLREKRPAGHDVHDVLVSAYFPKSHATHAVEPAGLVEIEPGGHTKQAV